MALIVRASLLASVAALDVPAGWVQLGPSNGDDVLRLSFALRQQNLNELERTFWSVSDPRSSLYGQFKTFEEIKAMVAPTPEAVEGVLGFLQAAGFSPVVNPGGDYVDVEMPTSEAARILNANISAFQSTKTKLVYHRALDGFTLPEALAPHVQHVFPLTRLPITLQKRSKQVVTEADAAISFGNSSESNWPRDCQGLEKDGMITPGVLRKRYNVSMPSTSKRYGSIATMLAYDPSDGCGFIQDDIAVRNQLCGMPAPVTVEVKGDAKSQYCPDTCRKNVGESCGESNLDVQTVTGIAEGVPTQFWITKSGDPLDMFKQYNEDASSALVLSCSFGDYEDSFDEDGGSRLETELKKAGVAGKTILFASGDTGVWKGNQIRHKKFSVGYPVSSVYVTAVGGSQFMPTSTDRGGDRIGTEVAVQGGPDGNDKWITAGWSGGGISNMFAAPDYQAQSVSDWYDAAEAAGTLPATSKWANKKNRGYPDLSALAGVPGDGGPTKTGKCKGECASYLLRQAGYWVFGQGTSASCPAVAAMIAMINEHRLAAGSPPMGAINTFLYQHSNAFDDITLGDNFNFDESKGYGGFKAAVGWDPVTGLGAPNVAALTQAAMEAVRSNTVV